MRFRFLFAATLGGLSTAFSQAAEISVGGMKLSDPLFQTAIELYLEDVPGVIGARGRMANGLEIVLSPTGPPSQFGVFAGPFATFEDFRTATIGNWQLTIEFTGGIAVYDFVFNEFRIPFTESDFPPAPTILSPPDGATRVDPSPTFVWDSGGPHTGPIENLFLNVYSLVAPSVFEHAGSFSGGVTLDSTTWTTAVVLPPGPAMFLVQYETNENEDAILGVPVFNAGASTLPDPGIHWTNLNGDLFARDLISFTVVPEPTGVAAMAGILIPLTFWLSTSRSETQSP